jgi:hypothetical protein
VKRYDNQQIMKACGSTSGRYDPESPEQTLYVLRNGEGEEKALAWVKTKTVFMSRSPYCVNEQGKVLWFDSMAAENGWSLKTAQNYGYRLNAQGRIRLKGKQIWYRADVPQSAPQSKDSDQPSESADRRFDFVHGQISPYAVEFIKSLPGQKQVSARSTMEAFLRWRRKFFAEGEASLRAIAEQVEDNTYLTIGLPKKRLPKRRPANTEYVQMSLKLVPDFVQSHNGNGTHESVQTAESTSYKPENRSVQTSVSLLSSDTDSDKGSSSSLRSSSAVVNKEQRAGGPVRGYEEPKKTEPARPPNDDLSEALWNRGYGHLLEDPDAIKRLRAELGDTPLDLYFRLVDERIKRANKGEQIGFGILLKKATQARGTWEREKAKTPPPAESFGENPNYCTDCGKYRPNQVIVCACQVRTRAAGGD